MPGLDGPEAAMFPVAGTHHADCSIPRTFAKHCCENPALQNHEIPVKVRRFLNLSSIEQMVSV